MFHVKHLVHGGIHRIVPAGSGLGIALQDFHGKKTTGDAEQKRQDGGGQPQPHNFQPQGGKLLLSREGTLFLRRLFRQVHYLCPLGQVDVRAGPYRVLRHYCQAVVAEHIAFLDLGAAFHAVHPGNSSLFFIGYIVH